MAKYKRCNPCLGCSYDISESVALRKINSKWWVPVWDDYYQQPSNTAWYNIRDPNRDYIFKIDEEEKKMTLGEAVAIFNSINRDDKTPEEKGMAIRRVLDMETHNSITKDTLLKVVRWLYDMVFEECDDKCENNDNHCNDTHKEEKALKNKYKFVYENIEELKQAIQAGSIAVEDEFITKDVDGEATFVVANINEKEIAFVRKFLLKDCKPMKNSRFSLIGWLNDEYASSLDEELKAMMIVPQGQQLLDLPREIEVFGRNEWGAPEEGSRWEYFKKLNNRICGTGDDAEYSEWWWLNTQYRASAAYFCTCDGIGIASYYIASYALFYVRPRFILAK